MIKAIAFLAMALLGWANGTAGEQYLTGVSPAQQSSELEQDSRRAIVETGFSESYFDKHFTVVATFNKPGDVRVVWKFSLNGYETSISDVIGYYTDHQRRIYVHSVKSTLGSTGDITRTISKQKAEALMRSCLGRYAGEAVVLMRFSPGPKVSLYLTAHSVYRSGEKERKIDSRKRNPESDVIENEGGERHPAIRLGYIDLGTGKCSKGWAIATP